MILAGDPIPNAATITVARKSDKSQLEFLIVEDEDALNVFDRGYREATRIDRLNRLTNISPNNCQRF
ncbi:hypothetical protein E4K67_07990 [Desulfosporosinus fructosivorans]|uniref:Uncharacterized protein n=1 Tax=Desulfosporosinus fructosivorans TaxID=2018669 RepID=A0A4Z0R865_9FIRM|nr:hypothetical protein [Desulfosporosinus fructosivorans]TGE39361.1 hypothetical protein E4K67_07990 [Desulfosporosinus fructosivorans]